MDNCIFCKIVQGELPSKKRGESENFIVIDTIDPVSEGHCLIIPKKHFENIFDLPSVLGDELLSSIKEQGIRLIKEKKVDGIKVVQNNGKAAGQVVMHFHTHIIPEKLNVKREKLV